MDSHWTPPPPRHRYTDLPVEAPLTKQSDLALMNTKPAWPCKGELRFDHLSMRYREGLDLVLKDLHLTIHAGEKVGVVGRTGAGKSSLFVCIFRIVEYVLK